MTCTCDYHPDDEDDVIESPIEHPAVEQANLDLQREVYETYGESQILWYRQGGRCYNCPNLLDPPMRFMLCNDDKLRCFGCKQAYTLAPASALDTQRSAA